MKPVLLVEDTQTDIMLMRYVWREVEVPNPLHVVEDGQCAIDYLAGVGQFADRLAHPLPCLVLLDLKIPYFSGHEVLQWIRQQPALKAMPVIILTSSTNDEDISQAYALGANAYLEKPMGMPRLKEMITHLRGFWLSFARSPYDPFASIHK